MIRLLHEAEKKHIQFFFFRDNKSSFANVSREYIAYTLKYYRPAQTTGNTLLRSS